MENIDTFEEFLEKKKQEENSQKVDWGERKRNWINSLENLYSSISEWLKPFEKQNYLKVRIEKDITLTEEYIGKYSVKRLDIYIGNDIVSLIPKGTLVIGSYGRVDMRGPKGEIMIIQPEWESWKFAQRTPKLETWYLTSESFKNILQELV